MQIFLLSLEEDVFSWSLSFEFGDNLLLLRISILFEFACFGCRLFHSSVLLVFVYVVDVRAVAMFGFLRV